MTKTTEGADLGVSDLTEAQARAELARLAALLAKANEAYHGQDAPEISDAEYAEMQAAGAAQRAEATQNALTPGSDVLVAIEPQNVTMNVLLVEPQQQSSAPSRLAKLLRTDNSSSRATSRFQPQVRSSRTPLSWHTPRSCPFRALRSGPVRWNAPRL